MTISTFEELPLAAPLQRALRENDYTTPSPVQAQAIPLLLEGKDLLGSAQTGTGKTAAFSLPILHRLATDPKRTRPNTMRTLVLTPTRELAVQVGESFRKYGAHVKFYQTLVYGGVSQHPQVRALRRGVDVLIATPGRLLDLHEQGHLDFSQVEFFVLDEVDRMLDMGFINDVRRVVKELPAHRQSLFFSATMAPAVSQLAETILRNPSRVSITPEATTAEKVEQRLCLVDPKNKLPLLADLINSQLDRDRANLTLVFSRTKHGANRLAEQLGKLGVTADAIHGNKSQAARQKALDRFRSGRVQALVATDVAARGIDVKNITLVVNFDLPEEAEAYVHRIGRTARAGEAGLAVSFVSRDELGLLHPIERRIQQSITVDSEHAYHAIELEPDHDHRHRAPAYKRGGGKGRRGGHYGGGGRGGFKGNRHGGGSRGGGRSFGGGRSPGPFRGKAPSRSR